MPTRNRTNRSDKESFHVSRHDDKAENEVHQVGLRAHGWEGTLLDNVADASRQGSGFNPMCNAAFPGISLFRDDAVGWNFEHIFNPLD